MKGFARSVREGSQQLLRMFFSLNFCQKITAMNQKRRQNSLKYRVTNFLLLLLFPFFIVCLAEINQMKTPSKFILFLAEKPSVVLFNFLLAGLIFLALLFLFRKGYLAVTILGIAYFALSTVELFKFNTSGNHLILTDMKMAANVSNLTSFAYIKITPELVTYVMILFLYMAAAFWFNPVLRMRTLRRMLTSMLLVAAGAATVIVPGIAMPVYAFFDIDTTEADNVFKVNEKFENNSFLAFLAETTTENFNDRIAVPANYTADAIGKIIDDSETAPGGGTVNSQLPNVITVMSEAFTDFRRFPELEIPDSYYADWDAVAAQGAVRTAVVPTFASFTVRTEFELNFGLPVKSLNDPNMPQRLLLDRAQPTIARYYNDLGYHTDYIHTFSRTFYSRDSVYANFGFDNLYFEDNLTVPVEYSGSYIADSVIFDQIVQILEENTDAPTYIHTTTMEDHQPYDEEGKTELEAYLTRVQNMLASLRTFLNQLESIDRPTVVLFMGDHLPCFKGEGNAYEQLDINGENCSALYEQPYLVWSNYDLDLSALPEEMVSSFYLPYAVMDAAGVPQDSFVDAMLNEMRQTPIYTTTYDDTLPNDSTLDMLTYDRVLGDKLSDNTSSTQIDREKEAALEAEENE